MPSSNSEDKRKNPSWYVRFDKNKNDNEDAESLLRYLLNFVSKNEGSIQLDGSVHIQAFPKEERKIATSLISSETSFFFHEFEDQGYNS